jgi:hypothetical protein
MPRLAGYLYTPNPHARAESPEVPESAPMPEEAPVKAYTKKRSQANYSGGTKDETFDFIVSSQTLRKKLKEKRKQEDWPKMASAKVSCPSHATFIPY